MNNNPELDHAIEKRNETYYSFCDKLMGLSTGAIALSVTFKSSLVRPSAEYLYLLGFSWSLFVLTIFAALIIHWSKAWIWNRRANEILNDVSSDGRLPKLFTFARWLMFISFFLAIVTFVFFAILNIHTNPRDYCHFS